MSPPVRAAASFLSTDGRSTAHDVVAIHGQPTPRRTSAAPAGSAYDRGWTSAALGVPGGNSDGDFLGLAAECLERGDRTGAAIHLERYVDRYPEQPFFRAQLAELLVTLGDDLSARRHFERYLELTARATGPLMSHRVHVHTRLMEIARRAGDRYSECYHRGVGLLALVREESVRPGHDTALCEEMLGHSLQALREAVACDPTSAAARDALAEVYERCGSLRAAEAERRAIRNQPLPSGLPPRLPLP